MQKDNNNLIVATFSMLLSLKCKYTFLSTPFTVCLFLSFSFSFFSRLLLRFVYVEFCGLGLTPPSPLPHTEGNDSMVFLSETFILYIYLQGY